MEKQAKKIINLSSSLNSLYVEFTEKIEKTIPPFSHVSGEPFSYVSGEFKLHLIELFVAAIIHKRNSDNCKVVIKKLEKSKAKLNDYDEYSIYCNNLFHNNLFPENFPLEPIENFLNKSLDYLDELDNFLELTSQFKSNKEEVKHLQLESIVDIIRPIQTNKKNDPAPEVLLLYCGFIYRLITLLNNNNLSDKFLSEADYLFFWDTFFEQLSLQHNFPKELTGNYIPRSIKTLISQLLNPYLIYEDVCIPSIGMGGGGVNGFLLHLATEFQFYLNDHKSLWEKTSPAYAITEYEINTQIAKIKKMIGLGLANIHLNIKNDDFFLPNKDGKPAAKDHYDLIICLSPSFVNLRSRYPRRISIDEQYPLVNVSEDLYCIFSSLKRLRQKGRMSFIIPQSSLTRRSYREARKFLCEKDLIEAIIEVPPGAHPNTSIPLVVLLFNNDKTTKLKNKILFLKPEFQKEENEPLEITKDEIDTIVPLYENAKIDKKRSRLVTREELQEHDFIIAPDVFFHDETVELRNLLAHGKAKRLGDLAKIVVGRNPNPKRKVVQQKKEKLVKAPFVKPNNLMGDLANRVLAIATDDDLIYAPVNSILNKKSILISRFQELKPTIYDPDFIHDEEDEKASISNGIFINPSIISIIPDESIIDFDYLYYQLYSPLVQKQLALESSGAKRVTFSADSLRHLIIPIFSGKEEQRVYVDQQKRLLLERENARHDAIKQSLQLRESEERSEQEKRVSEFQMIRHLTHNLKPKISIVKTTLETIKLFLEEKNLLDSLIQEPLDEDDQVDTVEVSLGKALNNSIQMTSVLNSVRQLVTQEILEQDFKTIDFQKFFTKEVEKLQNLAKNYQIGLLFHSKAGNWKIALHKDAFVEAINNLIRNAEIHGFTDPDKRYNMQFRVFEGKDTIIIEYTNDGNKFPKNINEEDFKTFGKKSKISTGEGLGGAWVGKFIEAHKGEFEILRDEYPVHLRITLPKGRK